jgi:hypothetical protein
MPERSGLGAQIGYATETTYGTYKAPTRFVEFESEGLTREPNYIEVKGLRAGRLAQSQNLHLGTTRTSGGDVTMQFLDQGMGAILNMLHGETVTPTKIVAGDEEAYKQLHKVGLSSPWGKSMTWQVGRPGTGGTVHPFSYLGCKVTSASMAVESGGYTSLTVTLDGQDETTGQALASPTYSSTARPFTFQEMSVKAGEATLANVRSITLTVNVPMNTERYHLGNSGVKDQPIANDYVDVMAEATLEFVNLADHTRFVNEESVALVLTAEGADIEEGQPFEAIFKLPAAKQVSSGPVVNGPDVITTDVSFKGLQSGSEPALTVETISTDTTL